MIVFSFRELKKNPTEPTKPTEETYLSKIKQIKLNALRSEI